MSSWYVILVQNFFDKIGKCDVSVVPQNRHPQVLQIFIWFGKNGLIQVSRNQPISKYFGYINLLQIQYYVMHFLESEFGNKGKWELYLIFLFLQPFKWMSDHGPRGWLCRESCQAFCLAAPTPNTKCFQNKRVNVDTCPVVGDTSLHFRPNVTNQEQEHTGTVGQGQRWLTYGSNKGSRICIKVIVR